MGLSNGSLSTISKIPVVVYLILLVGNIIAAVVSVKIFARALSKRYPKQVKEIISGS